VALLEKRDRPKIERKPVSTIDAPTSAKVFDAAREERIFIRSFSQHSVAFAAARSRPFAGWPSI
jgi:hypothetical protein